MTGYEKQKVMLANLYPVLPHDENEAAAQAVKFLNGGKNGEKEKEEMPLRLCSFEKDAGFIYSAFRQSHGIDLEIESMHWWKFLALFNDLNSDTYFCRLVNLRKRVKTGVATKEERQDALDLGEIFDIPEPDTRTPEEREREAEFLRLVEMASKKPGVE